MKLDVPKATLPWLTRLVSGASSSQHDPLEIRFSVRHKSGKALSEEEEVEVEALLAAFATKKGIDETPDKGGTLPKS